MEMQPSTFIRIASFLILSLVALIGYIGDIDTVCSLAGIDGETCGGLHVVNWVLVNQHWILPLASVLALIFWSRNDLANLRADGDARAEALQKQLNAIEKQLNAIHKELAKTEAKADMAHGWIANHADVAVAEWAKKQLKPIESSVDQKIRDWGTGLESRLDFKVTDLRHDFEQQLNQRLVPIEDDLTLHKKKQAE